MSEGEPVEVVSAQTQRASSRPRSCIFLVSLWQRAGQDDTVLYRPSRVFHTGSPTVNRRDDDTRNKISNRKICQRKTRQSALMFPCFARIFYYLTTRVSTTSITVHRHHPVHPQPTRYRPPHPNLTEKGRKLLTRETPKRIDVDDVFDTGCNCATHYSAKTSSST
jgi:hypothetical protein